MARPENSKTELGQRLRAFRKALGDPNREEFSRKLKLSFKSLGNYERGDSVPDANVLLAYRQTFNMNVDWLITGAGNMFLDGGPPSTDNLSIEKQDPAVQSDIFKETSKLVQDTHREKGVTLPLGAQLSETVSRYNELIAAARNPSDETELRALFPWLQLRISQDLDEAKNAPGKGKHPA